MAKCSLADLIIWLCWLSFQNSGCSILILFAVLNASRLFFSGERQREFCYGDTHVWNSTYQATVRLVEIETVSFAVALQQLLQRRTSACLSYKHESDDGLTVTNNMYVKYVLSINVGHRVD